MPEYASTLSTESNQCELFITPNVPEDRSANRIQGQSHGKLYRQCPWRPLGDKSISPTPAEGHPEESGQHVGRQSTLASPSQP